MAKRKINWKGMVVGIVIAITVGFIAETTIISSIGFLNTLLFSGITLWTLIFWITVGIFAVLGEQKLFKK